MEIVQQVEYINKDRMEYGLSRDCVQDYAYIIHDKDVYTEKDEEKNPAHKAGTLKPAHYHIALRFNDTQNSKYVAEWFGVKENYIQEVKGRWSDMLNYLTHLNRPEKYQYDDSEVVSNYEWTKDRRPVRQYTENQEDERLSNILEMIDREEMREYNLFNYVTLKEYTEYKRHIEAGFKYVYTRLNAQKERKMEVIFLTGCSGSGKTTYAKDICNKRGFEYFISSGGKNPLDDYKGQDAIIFDDMRASDYKYNELLKLLDNNTASMVASRYYNKSMAYCKLVIITSIQPIDEWYKSLQEYEAEPIAQLKRRCATYIEMQRETMKIHRYLNSTKEYKEVMTIRNPVADMFKNEEMSDEEVVEYLENLLGGMIEVCNLASQGEFKQDEEKENPFVDGSQYSLDDFE